jgi:hypothetical protein
LLVVAVLAAEILVLVVQVVREVLELVQDCR